MPLPRRLVPALAPILACLVASVLMYSCGSGAQPASGTAASAVAPDATPTPTTATLTRHLVPDAQVAGQPAGSPARAFLAFWQAAQYQDAIAVRRALTAELARRYGPDRLRDLLDGAIATFTSLPEVRGVVRRGDAAAVRFTLTFFTGLGEPSAAVARTLAMTREGDRWRIADLRLAEAAAARSRAERAAAARRAPGG